MNDSERFALRFGPYGMPNLAVGDVVTDELRGDVRVVGISDGRIQWPRGRKLNLRTRAGLILFGDLVRAVRQESNQAVAYWWGVTGQTVTKWRHALDVERTAGTTALRKAYTQEDWFREAQRNAVERARDPERCEKIAASKRGKKRPPHVLKALLDGSTGRSVSEATRKKMSDAHRRRGTRPPKAGRPWTAEEDELLRTLPAQEVVQKLGRTLKAVYSRRQLLGVPDGRQKRE